MTAGELREALNGVPDDTVVKIMTGWPYTRFAEETEVIGPAQTYYSGPYPFFLISSER